jgi:hypothetical protein
MSVEFLELNCWVFGEKPPGERVFTVEIVESKLVSVLKIPIR